MKRRGPEGVHPELWKLGGEGGGNLGGKGGGGGGDGGCPGSGGGRGGDAGGDVGGIATLIRPHSVHSPEAFDRRASTICGEPSNATTLLPDSIVGVSNDKTISMMYL